MRAITVTEKYRAVNEGKMSKKEFVRQMRQAYPMYVSPVGTYDSTVQILKNRNMLFEDKKQEVDDTFKFSDDSLRRAIDIELETMGLMSHDNVSSDDQLKAKKKAIANLKKDPLHYYHLISGDSSKVNKHDKEVEVKRGALEVDTFNGLKKAELKEAKLMTEGTRALIGYLDGDRLTATYNHYDGYPSNLGRGLETHYNDDDKAKDVALKGYITYLDPETGEIEQTHKDPPKKIALSQDEDEFARDIAEEIDSMGADYGYIWDDRANMWVTIKNAGVRSMIIQIMDKMGDYADLEEDAEEYLAKKDAAIKQAMGKDVEEVIEVPTLKETLGGIVAFLKSKGAGNDSIKDFIKTHKDDIQGMDMDSVEDEYNNFLSVNTDYIDEKKGKDHDGDGDVDKDDYMAAKDKAIKKAMGKDESVATVNEYRGSGDEIIEVIKQMAMEMDGDEIEAAMEVMEFIGEHYKIDFEFGRAGGGNYGRNDGAPYEGKVNEAVKSIIQKVLEEQVINEAATNDLAKIAEDYGDFEGLKPAVIALENVVTEIESFYDKTRAKIQKIYNDLGEVRNEEGLKVGAFIAPSIENAFKRDLRPIIKNQFHGGLEMPQVKRISQADVDRGYVQQEAPKQTVYTPVNEKKK